MTGRTKPKYRKSEHPDGGWDFGYDAHRLRAVRHPATETKKAGWAVYESKGKDNEQVFVAEGEKRDEAAFAAMDEIDLHNPVKPLLNAEHAAYWVKIHVKRFPAAVAFESVHDEHNALIGWTFWQQRENRYEFAWVTTDRRISPSGVNDRFQAAALMKTAVATTAGDVVPALVGAQGAAVDPPAPMGERAVTEEPAATGAQSRVLEGAVVSHTGTAKGVKPKEMDHPLMRAALRALGAELPQYHPGKLRLAEVSDHYDPAVPDTYDANAAWGALVELDDSAGTYWRLRGFWLEGGQYDRPGDPGLKVQLRIIADRLSRAGFQIERVGQFAVTAWHLDVPDDYEPTDLWTVTGYQNEEIACVEGRDFATAMEEARKVGEVKALMRVTGAAGFRRLSKREVAARGLAWAPQVVPPVRMVDAAGGGQMPKTVLPTYVKGAFVITRDGERHQVQDTVWRDWGEAEPVEHVITATGREERAADVAAAPAGELTAQPEGLEGSTTGWLSAGDDVKPPHVLCPDAHAGVLAAAQALEEYRTSVGEAERAGHMADAVLAAEGAAAKFYQATRTLQMKMWLLIVRAAVELAAARLYRDRGHAWDPAAPYSSLFGKSVEPLEAISLEGHNRVLDAARFWERYVRDNSDTDAHRRTGLAVMRGADEFARATGVGDADDWRWPVMYLAEIHTVSLLGKQTWPAAVSGR